MIKISLPSHGGQPNQALRRPGDKQGKLAPAFILLLAILSSLVAGCGTDPTSSLVSAVSPTVASPAPSPSRTQTVAPAWTALPTVPAAAPEMLTITPTATLLPTTIPSDTPSPVPSPSATATRTSTPTPSGPTITPTLTITATVKPTLTPTPQFSPTPLPTATYTGDVLHVLLMGLDSVKNLGIQNTDVIIVAVINKSTKQVSLLSIPRDLWVYIPTYGWSRVNVAHKIGHRTGYPGGGPGLLADTLKINLGIPIDHWVRVDFQGFARVVDALGGVEMTVACPVNLRYTNYTAGSTDEEMTLQPGVYHMDGATALRYVRTRRGGSDFDRAQRQHQFIKAMWDQTKGAGIILKIPGLWSALKGSYETDLTLGDVVSLAPLALDIQPQRIRSRYIGANQTRDWLTADNWEVLLPLPDKIQPLVASLYAPPSAAEDQAAKEAAKIQVRNGTSRAQLAQIAADQLRWYGLNVLDAGLAENPNFKQTQIIVYKDSPEALDLLVRVLKIKPENVKKQPDPAQPADIRVILGDDYNPCQ